MEIKGILFGLNGTLRCKDGLGMGAVFRGSGRLGKRPNTYIMIWLEISLAQQALSLDIQTSTGHRLVTLQYLAGTRLSAWNVRICRIRSISYSILRRYNTKLKYDFLSGLALYIGIFRIRSISPLTIVTLRWHTTSYFEYIIDWGFLSFGIRTATDFSAKICSTFTQDWELTQTLLITTAIQN